MDVADRREGSYRGGRRRQALLLVAALTAAAALGSTTSGASPKQATARGDGLTRLDAAALREAMRKARGGDLFVHLWASWCGPCMEELPDIDGLARQARARGATFLSVALDDPNRAAHVLDVLRQRAP
ncbi:MAG: TlpA disulfide reductase family protein, partial [Polyangia bacterium]